MNKFKSLKSQKTFFERQMHKFGCETFNPNPELTRLYPHVQIKTNCVVTSLSSTPLVIPNGGKFDYSFLAKYKSL